MKTTLTLTRIFFSFLATILVFAFSACKKDVSSGTVDITGKWAKTGFQGIDQYEFKNDYTVEYNALATDSVTKKIIGYRFRTKGKYSIKKDSLIMFDLANYSNSKHTFGPASELCPLMAPKELVIPYHSTRRKINFYFTSPVRLMLIAFLRPLFLISNSEYIVHKRLILLDVKPV
ncbi:hypothetical protein [Mucilaginibacter sp.]|uniref:hypothetical protein n=1 Tax=Mucilaginibacter sp. TaxID=1882438 RepID=UPI0025DBAD39|nr:hypothetical protein [Mucilaginibacter sp.]